jgi:hypothetical protein
MGVIKFPGSNGPDPTEEAPVEKKYVEPAETQYTDWKGTVALDEPHAGTSDDVFGLDRDRWAVVGFSLFGGGAAGDALSFRATVYAVEQSQLSEASGRTGGEKLQALADANDGEIPVVRLEYTKATVEDVLRTFKQFHIVALPAWFVDSGQRMRIEHTVNLGEEEEDELERQRDEE